MFTAAAHAHNRLLALGEHRGCEPWDRHMAGNQPEAETANCGLGRQIAICGDAAERTLFSTLIDAAPLGVAVVNRSDVIVYVNSSTERICGWRRRSGDECPPTAGLRPLSAGNRLGQHAVIRRDKSPYGLA